MSLKNRFILLLSFTAISSIPIVHADVEKGEELYIKYCTDCHIKMGNGDATALYTRTNRRVKDTHGLWKQVQRCEQNLGLQLFDDDIDALSAYLNKNFYHFENK